MLACGLNSAAYVAEIIRAGLQAVDNGQIEAARSLGMFEDVRDGRTTVDRILEAAKTHTGRLMTEIKITRTGHPQQKPNQNHLGFGKYYSDHMFIMFLSVRQQREAERMRVEALMAGSGDEAVLSAGQLWLDTFDDFARSEAASDALAATLEKTEQTALVRDILRARDQLSKKSFWMFGGDGWAYDIGFGGLDHGRRHERLNGAHKTDGLSPARFFRPKQGIFS